MELVGSQQATVLSSTVGETYTVGAFPATQTVTAGAYQPAYQPAEQYYQQPAQYYQQPATTAYTMPMQSYQTSPYQTLQTASLLNGGTPFVFTADAEAKPTEESKPEVKKVETKKKLGCC